MSHQTATPPSRNSYAISYDPPAGSDRAEENDLLAGAGTLHIRTTEPLFIFTGKGRGTLFKFSEAGEIAFPGERLSGISVEGSLVRCTAQMGPGATQKKPFIFYAASPQEADEIHARLIKREVLPTAARRFVESVKQHAAGRRPWGWVTNWLIAVNVLVFIAMGFLGAGWVEVADMMPYVLYGANNAAATTDGEWWRLITSMFMHYGLIHLAFNMWALFQVGRFAEKVFGRRLFALGYLGSGLSAGFVSMLWNGDRIWSAGASGAVFGVFGLLLGYLLREKRRLTGEVFQPLLKSLLPFVVYNLIFGLITPQIDNAAHAGGLLGGLLLGALCAVPVEVAARRIATPKRMRAGLAAIAAITVAGTIAAPRYNYRLMDDLNLENILSGRPEKDAIIGQEEAALITALEKGEPPSQAITWLNREGIPFYESLLKDLVPLKLIPGSDRADYVEELIRYLHMRLDAFRRLEADLSVQNSEALSRYHESQRVIAAEMDKLKSARQSRSEKSSR